MALLIDSSVLITLERRGEGLSPLLQITPDETPAIASITASELLVGAHRADTPERRARRETFIEAMLQRLPVLPFDLPAARIHAQLSVTLRIAGRPISPHDLLIAATALANGYAVLTQNVREFERVPGLIVQQPNW